MTGTVVSIDGSGIADALVEVRDEPPNARMAMLRNDFEAPVRATARTDGQGAFALLYPCGVGGKVLTASAPGYAWASVPCEGPGASHRIVLTEAAAIVVRVTTAAGAWERGLNVQCVVSSGLDPQEHVVSETVAPSGQAVLAGIPVGASATLIVAPTGCTTHLIRLPRVFRGDNDVEVRIDGGLLTGTVLDADTSLPISGARVVEGCGLGGGVRTDESGTFLIDGWAPRRRSTLVVTRDGYAPTEILVRTAENVVVMMRRPYSVTGTVSDSSGARIAGARVVLIGVSGRDGMGGALTSSTTSDAAGRFGIEGLDAKRDYVLTIHATGHARKRSRIRGEPSCSGRVDLGDFVLAGACELECDVVNLATRLGVAGATVDLSGPFDASTADEPIGAVVRRVTSDAGRCEFDGLSEGVYDVRVSYDGVETGVRARVEQGHTRTSVSFDLPPDSLLVRVTDESGEPVPSVIVQLQERGMRSRPVARITDRQGLARLPTHATSERTLAVTSLEGAERAILSAPEVRVERGIAERTIVVRRARSVRVTLLDHNERPIPGAAVGVEPWDDREGLPRTDCDGVCLVVVPENAGARVFYPPKGQPFSGAADGPLAGVSSIPVTGCDPVVLRCRRLPAPGCLRVRVLESDGAAVAGARIVVETDFGWSFTGDSDQSGSCDFDRLPVGEATVRCSKARGVWPPAGVTVSAQLTELVLRSRSVRKLRGRLLGHNGEATVGFVRALQDGITLEAVEVDVTGEFVISLPLDVGIVVLRGCVPNGAGEFAGEVSVDLTAESGPVDVRVR
ncbi:MAG: carboxypeptidase regulatory-like domain-containing protein [Planctomycetes bacterium]|nr:carboxypeptidase regulatory-like domain-containing protein [Planctomycetota bacterium]